MGSNLVPASTLYLDGGGTHGQGRQRSARTREAKPILDSAAGKAASLCLAQDAVLKKRPVFLWNLEIRNPHTRLAYHRTTLPGSCGSEVPLLWCQDQDYSSCAADGAVLQEWSDALPRPAEGHYSVFEDFWEWRADHSRSMTHVSRAISTKKLVLAALQDTSSTRW